MNRALITIREASCENTGIIMRFIRELASSIEETSLIDPEAVAKFLEFPGSHVFIAFREDQPLGMISCSIRPNLYHAASGCMIEELFVVPEARKEGIGSRLIEAVCDLASANMCAEISVSVLPENTRAVRFYKYLGFSDEALLLERHLSID